MAPVSKANLPGPTLALIIVAVMAALYGVDKFLAAEEQSEISQAAAGDFATGENLLRQGNTHQALASFARAHALNRTNRQYLLSLAAAQLADRQFPAARYTLDEALEEDSNDGQGNLLMARLMAAAGKYKDADSYYHRAIYGEWPSNAQKEVAKVRLELANMLAGHGTGQELLSELLLLENEPDQSLATRTKVAALFLTAGSAQRAADAYRRLIREDRTNADFFIGLGEADIELGNYHAAENAFLDALRRRLNDPLIQSQLGLVARLAILDPTVRRLSSAEKYHRSVEILELARSELDACKPGAAPKPAPADAPKLRGVLTNEMAEACLDEAEELWKRREEVCSQPPSPDDPLRFLMRKLSQ